MRSLLLPKSFRLGLCALSLAALTLAILPAARAADEKKDAKEAPKAAAAGVTGSWKWSFTPQNGGDPIVSTAKFAQDGEKLTGTITGGRNANAARETKIDEGSVKDGTITFKVSREANGQTFTTTYKGKVEGDAIKGTIDSTGRDGTARSRPWEATRVKEEAKEPAK